MSKFKSMLAGGEIIIGLPEAGRMRQCSIGKADKVLCFTITKGYIQSPDLDLCVIFTEYLKRVIKAKEVGNVNKVFVGDQLVYRQRIVFASILDIVRICAKYELVLRVDSHLRVTDSLFKGVTLDLVYLKQYFEWQPDDVKKLGFYGWMTACLVSQLYCISSYYGTSIFCSKNQDSLFSKGLWYRAPLLCARNSKDSRISSVVLLDDVILLEHSNNASLYDKLNDIPDRCADLHPKTSVSDYLIKFSSSKIRMFSFSQMNVLRDKKKGLIL